MKLHIKFLRLFAFLLLCGMFVPSLQGCQAEEQKVSKTGFYFDTVINVTLYGTSDESYIDECFSLADRYEHLLSNTIEDSEISKINAAKGSYVTVSDETLTLIEAGISYGDLSNGKFDITIGGLSDLWNISSIAENAKSEDNEVDASVLPSKDEIAEALSHVSYKNIEIKGNDVRLLDSQAKLDLGGIAKGYIADQMKAYLQKEGISQGIINLGGNVLTLGKKENGDTYSIGVQKPFAESGTSLGIVKVPDASVVSSGIYERYYRVNGKLYHHLLSTKNGYPIENNLYQVTIISPSSMDGDALSTTCFALGLTDGMQLIEDTDDVEAIFVTDDGEIHYSSGIGKSVQFEQ